MSTQRWTVGRATITSVVEERSDKLPPEMFFPGVTTSDVLRHPWVVPDFADARGRISLTVQAFVIEHRSRTVVVDPCVGNGKTLALAYWSGRDLPFIERFGEAGFDPARVDTVVHTHLHADHVGWDTQLAGDRWVPTFANARHLYDERELAWCKAGGNPGIDGVYEQSIAPILDAGLADLVAADADLGDGLRLAPTPGHTPGHTSLWIESDGATAIISGDFLHHPVQCAEPGWAEIGDHDADLARTTRAAMLRRAHETGALFLGTHFPGFPAGRIEVDGPVWRFVPVR